ncbi:MAG: DUF2460 domain-containing protein, partial [Sinobacteraceae bacterium]|nr:DUF2460 domain-containing protein [Nevskiaceae bacterium]
IGWPQAAGDVILIGPQYRALSSPTAFFEPVYGSANESVKRSGVPATGWSVADGVVTFSTAPASGHVLTWSGTYYYRCRFADDSEDFSQFLAQLYELKTLKLRTVL